MVDRKKAALGLGPVVITMQLFLPEWIVNYAIARLGAVINPVALLTPNEIEYVVEDCGAKAIIASPEKVAAILPVKGTSDRQ